MLSSASFVTMVKAGDLWNPNDAPLFWRLDRADVWRIPRQRQVVAALVVILEEMPETARQIGLIQDDDMIQAFPANGSNHAFYIGPLPRRRGCRQYLLMPMSLSC